MDMDEMDAETGPDPIALFGSWMQEAEESELNDASAVALATATRDGAPSVRMVLMKGVDAARVLLLYEFGEPEGFGTC